MNDLYFAQFRKDLPVIDLHGIVSKEDALDRLEHDLFLLHKKDAAYCRVVYGIGEGVLREAVLSVLRKNPMV